MRGYLFIALAIIMLACCMGAVIKQLNAPVPENVNIVSPDPSLPDELKALSGKWVGSWNSRWGWDCVLYVEKVDQNSAQVVHAWGEYTTHKQSCHCIPNWTRVEKTKLSYSNGKAVIEFKSRPYHKMSEDMHDVSGSVREDAKHYYTFSFTVDKDKPDMMKGHFISGKGSLLDTVLKKAH